MDGSLHKHDTASIIAEKVSMQGGDWAEKEAAASWLEETRKSVRAQLAVEHFKAAGSAAKAELLAEADQKYVWHVQAMVDARKAANLARVNYDSARMWCDLVRTQEATKRAEMNLR